MSRAASWQVLNQGFANLNNAMATIMRNKEAQRRMDLYEQFGNLDRAFRAQQAAQAQANADRSFNYGKERDAQSQKNWELNRQDNLNAKAQAQANWEWDYNQKAEIAKAAQEQRNIQNNNAILKNLVSIADQYGVDVANAYEFAQKGDPIAKNMLIAGIGEARKNAQIQREYELLKRHQYAMELAKLKKGEDETISSTDTDNKESIENLSQNLNRLNRNLDSWYLRSNSRRTDEDKRNATRYKIAEKIKTVGDLEKITQSGMISKSDAQEIAKINGWIR